MKKYIPTLWLLLTGLMLSANLSAQTCFDIHSWISTHPAVRDHINWQAAGGTILNYKDWTPGMKADLAQMALNILQEQDCGIADPPRLFRPLGPTELTSTSLYVEDAWKIYLAHIAQSIVADAFGYVNWSLQDAREQKLRFLFDSRSFFLFSKDHFEVLYEHGGVTLGDPLFVFHFLKKYNLIGRDQRETIERVLDWGRDSLFHYGSIPPDSSRFHTWMRAFGYQAYPPVKNTLTGVYDTYRKRWYHWSAGCHGTGGLLMAIMRVVNIEAGQEAGAHTGGHNLATFPEINAFLSHSDEVYSAINKTWPRMPVSYILLDYNTFPSLFADSLKGRNVSFPNLDLVQKFTPISFLELHCNAYSDSSIYNYLGFDQLYSISYLDSMKLFAGRNHFLDSVGGCFTMAYWRFFNNPMHPIESGADLLGVALNVPVLSQTIDTKNRTVYLKLKNCTAPDSIQAVLHLSRGAKATMTSGIVFRLDQPNNYQIVSEDRQQTRIWTVVVGSPTPVNEPNTDAGPEISPNPAKAGADITMILNGSNPASAIELYSSAGQFVNRIIPSAGAESVSMRAPAQTGIYVLRMYSKNGQVTTRRIIVMK